MVSRSSPRARSTLAWNDNSFIDPNTRRLVARPKVTDSMVAISAVTASRDTPRDSRSEPTATRRFGARVVRNTRAGNSTVSSERSLVAKANSGRPKRTRWTYQSPRRLVEGGGSETVCRGRCKRSRTNRVQRSVTTLSGRFGSHVRRSRS